MVQMHDAACKQLYLEALILLLLGELRAAPQSYDVHLEGAGYVGRLLAYITIANYTKCLAPVECARLRVSSV